MLRDSSAFPGGQVLDAHPRGSLVLPYPAHLPRDAGTKLQKDEVIAMNNLAYALDAEQLNQLVGVVVH